jgi:hypothetical protein
VKIVSCNVSWQRKPRKLKSINGGVMAKTANIGRHQRHEKHRKRRRKIMSAKNKIGGGEKYGEIVINAAKISAEICREMAKISESGVSLENGRNQMAK